jgi:predicted amidophosphoribosyltransferase
MSNATLLDFVFPSRCGVCEVPGPNLCEYCRDVLVCYAHEFQRGPVTGFAATYQSPEVSKLLVAFKDRGQSALVRELAGLVEPLVFEIDQLDQVVYLVPAPSRAENFARRGFTPSVLIAQAIAKSASKARVANCLVMGKAVKDQVGLTGAERQTNLSGSMSLNQKVAFKSCFVVDDICTTGATIIEAWRALTVAGANVLGALVVSEGKPPPSQLSGSFLGS